MIDQELTTEFLEWEDETKERQNENWEVLIDMFISSKKSVFPDFKEQIVGNSCCWDTDLAQNFQFYAYSDDSDWYYDEDSLIVIQTHNGADARGGHSDPVICRQKPDVSIYDMSVEWFLTEGDDPNIDWDEIRLGFTDRPTTHLLDSIAEEIIKVEGNEITIITKNGRQVSLECFVPGC